MPFILMRLREIEFLHKFWPLTGGPQIIKEFFLILINRRFKYIKRFLELYKNLTPDQVACINRVLHELEKLGRAVASDYPASGCTDAGCESCLVTYTEHYTLLVSSCFVNVLRHYDLPGIYEEETATTMLLNLGSSPYATSYTKEVAIELVRHYYDYLTLIDDIIRSLFARGQFVDIDRGALQKVIQELRSINSCLEFAPVPVNLMEPEAQDNHFYAIMSRLHFLVEGLIIQIQ